MNKDVLLPFKVGQLAESRSFQIGYRGAWFRCKIKEIDRRHGHIGHVLEFVDFPDEKIKWTRLYQYPPTNVRKSKGINRQLMVRPQYPPIIYRESEIPNVKTDSEVAVVIDGAWKVGDLIDWWTSDSYWCGRVTKILGNDKVKIYLLPRPLGEGLSYEVFCKDLRPSLDWSPECGWTVPIPLDGENFRPFARLIQLVNQEKSLPALDEAKLSVPRGVLKQPLSITVSKEAMHMPETNLETEGHAGEGLYYREESSKKMRTGGSISLNSMCSDTLEAAIMDLEELANRVKWLRSMLEFGIPLSNAVRPPWKFVEHHASSAPK
ncbi:uncharacterized protein LOC132297474 [Cornus florida]|uniref:uncharacterized protein LOC132297474 n=1 Tax=Cornus florida TaxID=4283 RepID=UPI00289847B1|nr:uncharacterized protein LOC132297474 [Cornus florida]XP_059650904.1 uncharacterized protein LOC132297474 [Cornus florida]XP_059650905.1 uncharacterized protein LOC132297474 [Cornus florida]XP_059650906.1 uncharacterized protein LOC132297474 [Cornus florida]